MKELNHKILKHRKQKIARRLKRIKWKNQSRTMMKGSNIQYEMDGRNTGIAQGGIGAIHMLAKKIGLVKGVNKNLQLLKRHLPSD